MPEAIKWDTSALDRELNETLHVVVSTWAVRMEAEIKESMVATPTAIGSGGVQRSLPGHPPAIQTAHLENSIQFEVDDDKPVARIGTNLPYGKFLELGVAGGKIIRPIKGKFLRFKGRDGKWVFMREVVQGRILPRPFLRRAMEKSREWIGQAIEAAYQRRRGTDIEVGRATAPNPLSIHTSSGP